MKRHFIIAFLLLCLPLVSHAKQYRDYGWINVLGSIKGDSSTFTQLRGDTFDIYKELDMNDAPIKRIDWPNSDSDGIVADTSGYSDSAADANKLQGNEPGNSSGNIAIANGNEVTNLHADTSTDADNAQTLEGADSATIQIHSHTLLTNIDPNDHVGSKHITPLSIDSDTIVSDTFGKRTGLDTPVFTGEMDCADGETLDGEGDCEAVGGGIITIEDNGSNIGDFANINFGDTLDVTDNGDTALITSKNIVGGGGGGSDNLGNHTATQDLDMAGFDVHDADTMGTQRWIESDTIFPEGGRFFNDEVQIGEVVINNSSNSPYIRTKDNNESLVLNTGDPLDYPNIFIQDNPDAIDLNSDEIFFSGPSNDMIFDFLIRDEVVIRDNNDDDLNFEYDTGVTAIFNDTPTLVDGMSINGEIQDRSPQSCAQGEALNTTGCENLSDGGGGGGNTPDTNYYSIPRSSVSRGDTISFYEFTAPAGKTIEVVYASFSYENGASAIRPDTGGYLTVEDLEGDTNVFTTDQSPDTAIQRGTLGSADETGHQYGIKIHNDTCDDTTVDCMIHANANVGVRFN